MTLIKAAKLSDIPPGGRTIVLVGETRVILFNAAGKFYAVEDICSHDEGSLDNGPLEDLEVECPRHGARFDIRTGEATRMPAIAPIRAFPVKVEGDNVLIETNHD